MYISNNLLPGQSSSSILYFPTVQGYTPIFSSAQDWWEKLPQCYVCCVLQTVHTTKEIMLSNCLLHIHTDITSSAHVSYTSQICLAT
ncbi:hypothetical protein GDO78_016236 [Eleutherodactylus coqui]|uniref:Uncharacterized protein n=1 Tax=Eleutherodactylus coqui TaxID=57060 RepID=A0A8J6E3R6_ELECQ|nr:hypothetical protein GDO78_016236 [Eleutherodactylus coqui]